MKVSWVKEADYFDTHSRVCVIVLVRVGNTGKGSRHTKGLYRQLMFTSNATNLVGLVSGTELGSGIVVGILVDLGVSIVGHHVASPCAASRRGPSSGWQ